MISLIAQPHHPYRIGDFICENLKNPKWKQFRASIAFVKKSGTQYIKSDLKAFSAANDVCLSVGIDHGGSSAEGLTQLLDAVAPNGKIWVYKNPANTFHPKVYLFRNAQEAEVIVGSGNMTKGGLYENAELGIRVKLNLSVHQEAAFLMQLEETLNIWSTLCIGQCLALDVSLIELLKESGELPTETESLAAIKAAKAALMPAMGKKPSPFNSQIIHKAPALSASPTTPPLSANSPTPITPAAFVKSPATSTSASTANPSTGTSVAAAPTVIFGITLQNTDVGVGQTTAGKSKRSPELFIPLGAFDAMPPFWGWINKGTPDPIKYQPDLAWRAKNLDWIKKHSKPGRERPLDKFDWPNVQIDLKGQTGLVMAQFWFNPDKGDIRMRANSLRSAGSVGDILLIRQAHPGSLHQYDMEVVKQSDPTFPSHLSKLTNSVKNSKKRFGYF